MSRWEKKPSRFREYRWLKAFGLALLIQLPLLYMIQVLLESGDGLAPLNPLIRGGEAQLELTPDDPKKTDSEVLEEYKAPEAPEEIDGTEVPIGQIVEIAPPEVEEMPERADYSARYASKVRQEQRARQPTKDKTPSRVPHRTKPVAAREGRSSQGEKGSDAASSEEASSSEEAATASDSGAQGEHGLAAREMLKEGSALVSPSDRGKDPFENVKSLGKPYASDDYLGHLDKTGDTNVLNTMPYRYIGFFERVKAGVRREWNPNRVYRRKDPSGDLFGYKDRMTVLRVVMDREGYLEDATVLRTSGLKFLDEEAKRAMWAAAPFLNPPAGLLKDDSKIRFEFGFVFLIASSNNRFFWKLQ